MPYLQSILLISSDPTQALVTTINLGIETATLDDLIIQSDKAIGIDAVRDAKIFAASAPVINQFKQIAVIDAEKLTPEAQNAFLKLLEEPPTYLHIVLAARNTHQLLDTIISRCQIITLQNTAPTPDSQGSLASIINLNPQERLNQLPVTSTKEAALIYSDELIAKAKSDLRTTPNHATAFNLETLLTCQSHLHQNTNPTLTITDAVLSLLPHEAKPATMAKLPKKSINYK